MYISMDEFKKMAEQPVSIGDGPRDIQFIGKLALHFAAATTAAICTAIAYFDKPDNDKVVILSLIHI